MAINATRTVEVTLTGQGLGAGAAPFLRAQSIVNNNAPPPATWSLSAGNNSFVVPAGFTVNQVDLEPPSGSANVKTIKGVNGDTGIANWTAQEITLPTAAGATIVINSVGSEALIAVFS